MVSNFQNTDNNIQNWNLKGSPFKLKHNNFSILDDQEFKSYLGLDLGSLNSLQSSSLDGTFLMGSASAPDSSSIPLQVDLSNFHKIYD